VLIILSGLPGVGKTTLARAIAALRPAVLVRVDGIEQALREGGIGQIDGLGYHVAYAVAAENLRLGNLVIADTVNPWELTREAWRSVGTPHLEVEVICSDEVEHRRRVETRLPDLLNFKLPTWQDVIDRDYYPWTTPRLVVDLAKLTPEEGAELVLSNLW
jgi:predicted kinase